MSNSSSHRRIVAGITMACAAATFGPLLADVGEQSGNHPEPAPGSHWIRTDERTAAAARWYHYNYNGEYTFDEFSVSAWTRTTRLTSDQQPDPQTTAESGITLTHVHRVGGVVQRHEWRGSAPSGATFAADPIAGIGRLRATLSDAEGQTCTLDVDWLSTSPYAATRWRTTVNTAEQSRIADATGGGTCLSLLPVEERTSTYNRLWRRFERRSSEDIVADDRLSPGGIITVAGTGDAGYSGDGGFARWAMLAGPSAVTTTPDGSIFIVEGFGKRIRRVTSDGIAQTLVSGGCALDNDRRPLPQGLCHATAITGAPDGSVFVSDAGIGAIRRLWPDGTQAIVAFPDITDPNSGRRGLLSPRGLALDPTGRLYVAEEGRARVLRIDLSGAIQVVAGNGTCAPPRDGVAANQTSVCGPSGLAFAGDGSLYITQPYKGLVRRVAPDDTISTILTDPLTSPPVSSRTSTWTDVAVGPDLKPYISDDAGRILRIDAPGRAVLVAGSPCGICFDGGPAVAATLSNPQGIAFDRDGHLLIAEAEGHAIRMADVVLRLDVG